MSPSLHLLIPHRPTQQSNHKLIHTLTQRLFDNNNNQQNPINISNRNRGKQARNKITQYKLKVTTDSMEAVTASNNYNVSEEQYKRYEELVVKGVISKTDLENRKVKLQDAMAKKTSSDNKFMSASFNLNASIFK